MSLSSESYLVGLIGDGITTSLSPYLHEQEAKAHGLDYLYRPVDLLDRAVKATRLPELLEFGRIFGFNALTITHPCKQSVIPLLDRLTPDAEEIGAVNTVIIEKDGSLSGHNTDWSGYAWAVRRRLENADFSSVVMFGAGGAGSAVGYALLKHGVGLLTIVDPDSVKAAHLAEQLRSQYPSANIVSIAPENIAVTMETASGLVNASPIGMHMHPGLPVDEKYISKRLWVSDVVYRPLKTELIVIAEERGCLVMHGGFMAVGQAIDGFEAITGVQADGDRMLIHFEQMITAGQ
ncbi:MAG: shikimate dehydrogenase [Microbacteriaceae bacterium]